MISTAFPARLLALVALLASASISLLRPALAQESLQNRLRDFRVGDFWIYDDWPAARELARETGAPIFAVFRCVP